MKILEKYEIASGQKLNMSKTSIFFFSRNTSQPKRREITSLFGIQATDRYDTYLGYQPWLEGP
jgi:hypothetical protein